MCVWGGGGVCGVCVWGLCVGCVCVVDKAVLHAMRILPVRRISGQLIRKDLKRAA